MRDNDLRVIFPLLRSSGDGILSLPRRPLPAPFRRLLPVAALPPHPARPVAGPVVDFQSLARRREAGECGATLVLVQCAAPRGALERTAVSALVPPMPAGISRWEAFWSDDEGYVLRAVRDDDPRRVEWFTLAMAGGTAPVQVAGSDAPPAAPRGVRLHTVLVGWRPLGSGASRWSVASRRA